MVWHFFICDIVNLSLNSNSAEHCHSNGVQNWSEDYTWSNFVSKLNLQRSPSDSPSLLLRRVINSDKILVVAVLHGHLARLRGPQSGQWEDMVGVSPHLDQHKSSNCFSQRIHCHVGCISWAFLHCVFSNVSSNYKLLKEEALVWSVGGHGRSVATSGPT